MLSHEELVVAELAAEELSVASCLLILLLLTMLLLIDAYSCVGSYKCCLLFLPVDLMLIYLLNAAQLLAAHLLVFRQNPAQLYVAELLSAELLPVMIS